MNSTGFSFPRLLIIHFLIIYISACSENSTVIIEEQKFIEIYAHLLIFEEIEDDSIRTRLKKQLLIEHDVQTVQIDSTLIIYKNNPEQWPEVVRQIRDRIKELREKPVSPDSLDGT